jgi:hypothetical protein
MRWLNIIPFSCSILVFPDIISSEKFEQLCPAEHTLVCWFMGSQAHRIKALEKERKGTLMLHNVCVKLKRE